MIDKLTEDNIGRVIETMENEGFDDCEVEEWHSAHGYLLALKDTGSVSEIACGTESGLLDFINRNEEA